MISLSYARIVSSEKLEFPTLLRAGNSFLCVVGKQMTTKLKLKY